MPGAALETLAGYRRRFVITPGSHEIQCELEDDFHHMSVVVRHADGVATDVDAVVARAPWTTCPAAVAQLKRSFIGVPLDAFGPLGGKPSNCTHLFDLAQLAAAHARDTVPMRYDIRVSDPVNGRTHAALLRDDVLVFGWTLKEKQIVAPPELVGMAIDALRPLIQSLPPVEQEYARLLRWGSFVARGRALPIERQSNALTFDPLCFTFQPENKVLAQRIIDIRNFVPGGPQPLDPAIAPPS